MNEWTNERMNEWTNERMNERTNECNECNECNESNESNEWTNEQMNVWTNERMNEWTNERMNEWPNERMNEWTNEWTNERMNERMNEWTNERMNEWTNDERMMNEWWTNERMNEWTKERTNERMNGWMDECMNGWMDEWMDGWMHGCMDAWMHGCMDAWMHGCMDAWMHGCMDAWMHGWMDEWMNEWMNDWMNEWMKEWMNINEWMNERTNEWMNEWVGEWMSEWVNEWVSEWVNEWVNEWVSEWMNEQTNERTNERTKERMNEWINEFWKGSLARKLRFHIFNFHFLRKSATRASFSHLPLSLSVSQGSFVLTSSTFRFWRKSPTKASFPHLQLSLFEEVCHESFVLTSSTFTFCLPRQLCSHIFHFQILKEVSHENFVFTSSTFRFWGKSRTKCFWELADARMLCFAGQNMPRKVDGVACLRDDCGTRSFVPGSCSDRPRIGTASWGLLVATWTFKIWRKSPRTVSFSHLPLSLFEGSLPRQLRFHIFHFLILKEVSHESFVFTSSTFTLWRKSRTTASFSHLPLSLFEGSLARQFRPHIFHFHFLTEVSHDSFVLTSSTFTFWGKSPTTVSFSHLPLSFFEESLPRQLRFHIFHFLILKEVSHESFVFTSSTFILFEGSLAQQLRFHIFHFHFLREVSHDSFVLTSSTLTFWGKSPTTVSFSHLPLSLFEGSLARRLRFHIFHFHFLRDVSHEMRFWEIVDARNAVFCRTKRVLEDVCVGKLVRRTGARRSRLCSDHGWIGPALELRVQASFSQFELAKFEGSFARQLRFHIFHFQIFKIWTCFNMF